MITDIQVGDKVRLKADLRRRGRVGYVGPDRIEIKLNMGSSLVPTGALVCKPEAAPKLVEVWRFGVWAQVEVRS